MDRLATLLRRLGAALGNDGAVANAGALGRQRRQERWRIAALERSLARRVPPARRTERVAS